MNTRPAIESSSAQAALSASFNRDASMFAVGLESGFCVFKSDPCSMSMARDFNAGIGAVELAGKINFVALIGGGKQPKFSQNKVIIWDDKKQKVAVQVPVLTPVRGVRLSRTHIVVALQSSVRVYKLQAQPELWAAFETASNPFGICCLTDKTIAFPGRTEGQVQLVELLTGNVSIIPAHTSPLRAIDISQDGEVLATASKTGTLVRVFATSSCARLAEVRRGVDPAVILSVAISPSGKLLAVTSDKSTLHVFDIPHPSKPPRALTGNTSQRYTTAGGGGSPGLGEDEPSQKWGLLSRIPMLPRVFSDQYSFASTPFEMGEEPLISPDSGVRPPPKGIIGWTSEDTIVIIGAGVDSRWEKFVIAEGEDGRRHCVRDGWKRLLGAR